MCPLPSFSEAPGQRALPGKTQQSLAHSVNLFVLAMHQRCHRPGEELPDRRIAPAGGESSQVCPPTHELTPNARRRAHGGTSGSRRSLGSYI